MRDLRRRARREPEVLRRVRDADGRWRSSAASAATPSPRAPSGPAAAVAERRLVSVLFADLVGFTPFTEERDSEEVRETLTRYFEHRDAR